MLKLLLSPHDDDAHLFCCFTAIREKPLTIIVSDSWIQPNRGELGCSAKERAAETQSACVLLGCAVTRMWLRDDSLTENDIVRGLEGFKAFSESDTPIETVYAPALQYGNAHHDMVHRAAHRVFPGKVANYTTYTRTELYTTGSIEVMPTLEELRLKEAALNCYASQLRINRPHFEAVLGKSEWFA